MGICKEIYDSRMDNFNFVVDLMRYHGRYQFSEIELNRMRLKENMNGIKSGMIYSAIRFDSLQ